MIKFCNNPASRYAGYPKDFVGIRIISRSTRRFIGLRLRFDKRSIKSLLSIFNVTCGLLNTIESSGHADLLTMIRESPTVDEHRIRRATKWMKHMLWIQQQIGMVWYGMVWYSMA